MKNKKIEELLKEIKFFDGAYVLEGNNRDLLLSYIEQLEKENDRLKKDYAIVINNNCDYLLLEKKIEQLEKRNKEIYEGFMATQEELTDYATENEQLKKQRDDVVEYIKEHIKYECDNAFNGMQFYSYHLYDFNKEELLRMLGEIDVED